MTTFTKKLLSGSTDGKGIKVVATATVGTLIHTVVAGTDKADEVWLYMYNIGSNAETVTLEWGGLSADNAMKVILVANEPLSLKVPGLLLQNGLTIGAFSTNANQVFVFGYVHEVDPV